LFGNPLGHYLKLLSPTMLKCKIIKIIAGTILLNIALNSGLFAQGNKEYPVLSKFSKWGIVAGPVLYNSAKIYPQYGDYTFDNRPIWGFNAGIEYDFNPDRKWSLTTGLILAYEPVYKIHYCIKEEDLYPEYTEDAVDKAKMYAMLSFSAPLLVRLNIQVDKKIFANFSTGLKVMYFPSGDASFSLMFHNGDGTEAREVFGLRLESPDNAFQGSFVIGTGMSVLLDKILLKSNLIYVMNFQNTITGEYQFGNLFTSPPARGDYELSGNYLGLLFSVSIAKNKNKY
jgi:hypothetical protein